LKKRKEKRKKGKEKSGCASPARPRAFFAPRTPVPAPPHLRWCPPLFRPALSARLRPAPLLQRRVFRCFFKRAPSAPNASQLACLRPNPAPLRAGRTPPRIHELRPRGCGRARDPFASAFMPLRLCARSCARTCACSCSASAPVPAPAPAPALVPQHPCSAPTEVAGSGTAKLLISIQST